MKLRFTNFVATCFSSLVFVGSLKMLIKIEYLCTFYTFTGAGNSAMVRDSDPWLIFVANVSAQEMVNRSPLASILGRGMAPPRI